MKKIYQNKFESPSGRGNPLSACIASIMDIDLEEVPYFEEMHNDTWWLELNRFCIQKGFLLFTTEDVNKIPTEYYICIGKSVRDLNIHHACIYNNKQELFHDPNKDNKGLISEKLYLYLIKVI